MDSKKIIDSLKTQYENKISVSLKLPESIKNKLQSISDFESLSMNALIVSCVESFIDDYEHKKDVSNV